MSAEISVSGKIMRGRIKVAWLGVLREFPLVSLADFEASTSENLSFRLVGAFDLGMAVDQFQLRWYVRNFAYITDPQAPGRPESLLQPGTRGFLAVRFGAAAAGDWADGQLVNVFPVLLGQRFISGSSDDEFAKFVYKQQVEVYADPLTVTVGDVPMAVAA